MKLYPIPRGWRNRGRQPLVRSRTLSYQSSKALQSTATPELEMDPPT